MAADQCPKKNDTPYWQTFLNRETAFHTGTEKISKVFKYPLIFMSMKRTRKGHYEAALKLLAEPPYMQQPNEIMQKYINENRYHRVRFFWLNLCNTFIRKT